VCARAPWFLAALVELLSALVERHGAARVFFIHGWNICATCLRSGDGPQQRGNRVIPAGKAAPTLSAAFFTAAVLPFRHSRPGQGSMWHSADVTRLPTKTMSCRCLVPVSPNDHSPLIRTLPHSLLRKVDAVQLELGVGLRWPGPERERFVEVFCQLWADASLCSRREPDFSTLLLLIFFGPGSSPRGSPLALPYTPEPTRLGLHFHDPASGLGVMGGVEFDRSASTYSGRLLLSLGGSELILFTGEDDATADPGKVRVGGFVWQRHEDGLTISYRGTVMRVLHPQAFIRLEEGLAASWIEPAAITLHLTLPQSPSPPPLPLFLTQLRGEIRLRDRRCALDAWGFLDMLKSEETGGCCRAGCCPCRSDQISGSFSPGSRLRTDRAPAASSTTTALRTRCGLRTGSCATR